MSEREKWPTFGDLVDFIEAHQSNNPCEACGGKKWAVDVRPDGMSGIPLFYYDQTAHVPVHHIPVIVMVCADCCTIRQLAWTAIAKKMGVVFPDEKKLDKTEEEITK